MSSIQDLQLAINRVYRALASRKGSGTRDIRLGLDRVKRVVPPKQLWKGVHVAGTNGKGSICAFLAGLFKLAGVGYGSYISPAFPEKHNAVTINGLYVNPRMYEMEMKHVQAKWDRIASGWKLRTGDRPETISPFELETASAFRVFNKMRVPYGIVEVGMGGATDATNVMKQKAVTIISKIGLDHQEYLGNSIEAIAKVKAGIMQAGVPCVVDHTNQPSVIRVLREHAREVGTELILTWKAEPFLMTLSNEKWKLEGYQIQNLLCAALAFRQMFPLKDINLDQLMSLEPYLPGRMEYVKIALPDSGPARTIFVDGAHNMLGIEGLEGHVEKHMRQEGKPVTWIMGMSMSKHKPFAAMLNTILRPEDNFAFVEYAPGPNDPPPSPANYGHDLAKPILNNSSDQLYEGDADIGSALRWSLKKAGADGPIVVTGSLYLVRELFSLDGVTRKRHAKTRRPGRSQLYRFIQLAQRRSLSEDERRQFRQARRHWYLSPLRNATFSKVREGGQPTPPQTPEDVSELQRTAAYHRQQEDGYKKAIASISNDLTTKTYGSAEVANEKISTLATRVEDLAKLAAKHHEDYNAAMFKLRGYDVEATRKYMGYRKIFGRAKKRRSGPESPYVKHVKKTKAAAEAVQAAEAAEKKTKPVDWDSIEAEEKSSILSKERRRLRREMDREKNEGEEEEEGDVDSDAFQEKISTQRR